MEVRAKKIDALQKQAVAYSAMKNEKQNDLQYQQQKRRDVLGVQMELKKKYEQQARNRGIVPPDERPVKYNPDPPPIGITQALNAIGAPSVSEPSDYKAPAPVVAVSSPSKSGDPRLRKNILKRVNQRYSTDYEEDTDDVDVSCDASSQPDTDRNKREMLPRKSVDEPRPLPAAPIGDLQSAAVSC